MKKLKILCICLHGNTRSVALAYLIKTIYGHEAVACGFADSSLETLIMLFKWADKVIVLDKMVWTNLDIAYLFTNNKKLIAKTKYLDVGKDIWFNPKDQELIHKLLKQLKKLSL